MRKARLGLVEFDAIFDESLDHSAEITDEPVEFGVNVADHVRPLSFVLEISGIITGDGAAQRLEMLRRYRDQGALLTYIGRNIVHGLVIESLKTTHDVQIRGGFTVSLTLQQVRIAVSQTAAIAVPPELGPQVQDVGNAGSRQPANK